MGKFEVEINLTVCYYWYKEYLAETVRKAAQMERAQGLAYIVSKVEEFIESKPYRSQLSKTAIILYVNNLSLYLCGMMDAKREALEDGNKQTA